jgi:hypothetical protein
MLYNVIFDFKVIERVGNSGGKIAVVRPSEILRGFISQTFLKLAW